MARANIHLARTPNQGQRRPADRPGEQGSSCDDSGEVGVHCDRFCATCFRHLLVLRHIYVMCVSYRASNYPLRDQIVQHVPGHVGQTHFAAAVEERELFVVEPHQV